MNYDYDCCLCPLPQLLRAPPNVKGNCSLVLAPAMQTASYSIHWRLRHKQTNTRTLSLTHTFIVLPFRSTDMPSVCELRSTVRLAHPKSLKELRHPPSVPTCRGPDQQHFNVEVFSRFLYSTGITRRKLGLSSQINADSP